MSTQSRAVFLSYASEDAEAAQRIAEALRAADIEAWFDKSELRGGDAWDRQIRKQIHDCALFIPIISAHSQARLEGYFRREWKLAADRTHDMAEEKAFLVPVVIDDTSERYASVPEKFRDVQWTRLPAGETSPAFVERVQKLLSSEPSATRAAASAVPPGSPGVPTGNGSVRSYGRSKLPLWAIGAVLAVGLAYTVVDRFWLSKHVAAGTQAAASKGTSAAPAQETIPEKSIAVLPFVDMSEKQDQEYFADGMAEEVLDLLANIPGLKVIGRTSSFQFKGKNQDLRAIASALGVSYVVEGSVRRSGERVRVTAQLVNALDGSHLWSDTYDEPVDEILKVQDRIASNLVRALQVSVGADLPERPSFKSPEVYDLYLRGRHAYDRFDKPGLDSAAAYFQQALELDPHSVLATECLAMVQMDSAEFGFVSPSDGLERARQTAQRALQLDPRSSLAYVVLSSVHLYDWDWLAAERDAKEALRLKPRSESPLGALGQIYLALGRWDDSTRFLETAITLDPLFPGWHQLLGEVRLATGQMQDAENEARKVLQISPTYSGAHFDLGTILLAQGKLAPALDEMQLEQPDSGRDTGLAIAYHAMSRRAESDAALARLTTDRGGDSAYEIAEVHAYRGEPDQAFAWLERAYAQKDSDLLYVKGDILLKNLVTDPRFHNFLHKMNLPE